MAQLLSNLPVGALIKFGKHQVGSETAQPIIWVIADKNHSGYPSNSVSLMTQKLIDLRAYDGIEKDIDGETTVYGNINYGLSNIHQWLNSSSGANSWYKASHSRDTAPTNGNTQYSTGYDNRAGFLSNFNASERNALLPTTLTIQTNETLSNIVANVFLPSLWEITGTHSISDGSSKLAYFTSMGKTCALTSQAYTNTTCTNKPSSSTANWEYMTRSTQARGIYRIMSNGAVENGLPYVGSYGLRPIINLSANTKISDAPDEDGCYKVESQSAPVISWTDQNEETEVEYYTEENGFPDDIGFKKTYEVSDIDNDRVTVTEYIDNVKIRSYEAALGATNNFNVTGNTWLKLANGVHTLKITATDGFDEATITKTFTKSAGLLAVQRKTAISAGTVAPTHILVTVAKNIPDGAEMKVYACNNGFDTEVVWEEVEPGVIHAFTNKSKTSGEYGVNVRVTVDRKGKDGACYITEIGGNFK